MVDNIERVLERGEKIELLVDKTDNLRFQVIIAPDADVTPAKVLAACTSLPCTLAAVSVDCVGILATEDTALREAAHALVCSSRVALCMHRHCWTADGLACGFAVTINQSYDAGNVCSACVCVLGSI